MVLGDGRRRLEAMIQHVQEDFARYNFASRVAGRNMAIDSLQQELDKVRELRRQPKERLTSDVQETVRNFEQRMKDDWTRNAAWKCKRTLL